MYRAINYIYQRKPSRVYWIRIRYHGKRIIRSLKTKDIDIAILEANQIMQLELNIPENKIKIEPHYSLEEFNQYMECPYKAKEYKISTPDIINNILKSFIYHLISIYTKDNNQTPADLRILLRKLEKESQIPFPENLIENTINIYRHLKSNYLKTFTKFKVECGHRINIYNLSFDVDFYIEYKTFKRPRYLYIFLDILHNTPSFLYYRNDLKFELMRHYIANKKQKANIEIITKDKNYPISTEINDKNINKFIMPLTNIINDDIMYKKIGTYCNTCPLIGDCSGQSTR